MPQLVSLTSGPASQTFTATLAGQACTFALYLLGTGDAAQMYMDLTSNGVAILNGRLVRAWGGQPNTRAAFMLVGRRYLGFLGDLLFIDTQAAPTLPTADPQPSGLGTRWQLMYYSQADLQAAGFG